MGALTPPPGRGMSGTFTLPPGWGYREHSHPHQGGDTGSTHTTTGVGNVRDIHTPTRVGGHHQGALTPPSGWGYQERSHPHRGGECQGRDVHTTTWVGGDDIRGHSDHHGGGDTGSAHTATGVGNVRDVHTATGVGISGCLYHHFPLDKLFFISICHHHTTTLAHLPNPLLPLHGPCPLTQGATAPPPSAPLWQPHLLAVFHRFSLRELRPSHLVPPALHCPVQELLHLPLREDVGVPKQLVVILIDCGEGEPGSHHRHAACTHLRSSRAPLPAAPSEAPVRAGHLSSFQGTPLVLPQRRPYTQISKDTISRPTSVYSRTRGWFNV